MMPWWAILALTLFGLAWLTLDVIGFVKAWQRGRRIMCWAIGIATFVIIIGLGFMLAGGQPVFPVAVIVICAVIVDMIALLWLDLTAEKPGTPA